MTVKEVYKDANGLHRFVIDISLDTFIVIETTLELSLDYTNDDILKKDIAIRAPDKLERALLMTDKVKTALKEIQLKDKP